MAEPDPTWRKPTDLEVDLVELLMSRDFRGHAELVQQLSECEVKTLDRDGSFGLRVRPGARAVVDRRVPVEFEFDDDDGGIVHVLLHVVDGLPDEVEIYRDDSSPPRSSPQGKELRFLWD